MQLQNCTMIIKRNHKFLGTCLQENKGGGMAQNICSETLTFDPSWSSDHNQSWDSTNTKNWWQGRYFGRSVWQSEPISMTFSHVARHVSLWSITAHKHDLNLVGHPCIFCLFVNLSKSELTIIIFHSSCFDCRKMVELSHIQTTRYDHSDVAEQF